MKKILLILCGISVAAGIMFCPASVSAVCSVSMTGLSFGNYDVFSSVPLDTEGSVSVLCNQSPPPTVTISIGASSNSGSFDPRAMKLIAENDLLVYNLYTDATRTQIWGDGSGNTAVLSAKVFKNKSWNNVVYGRIAPLQDIAAGAYSETIVVTILW